MKITPKIKKIVTLSLILLVSSFAILGLAGVFTPKENPTPTFANLESVYLENHYSKYLSQINTNEPGTAVSISIPSGFCIA